MATTPVLGLTLLEAAQAQKHVTMNEALLALDALVLRPWQDIDVTCDAASKPVGLSAPQGASILGATLRVMSAVTGAATAVTLGDDGDGGGVTADLTRYASITDLSAGVTGGGWAGVRLVAFDGALPLRLTFNAAPTGGVIRVRLYWAALAAPAE